MEDGSVARRGTAVGTTASRCADFYILFRFSGNPCILEEFDLLDSLSWQGVLFRELLRGRRVGLARGEEVLDHCFFGTRSMASGAHEALGLEYFHGDFG
jgi:hypothetical protein